MQQRGAHGELHGWQPTIPRVCRLEQIALQEVGWVEVGDPSPPIYLLLGVLWRRSSVHCWSQGCFKGGLYSNKSNMQMQ